jgi:hypothetical protein
MRICITTSKAFLACLFILPFYIAFYVSFAQNMAINVAVADTHQMSFTTSNASHIGCCIGMCFYYSFWAMIL